MFHPSGRLRLGAQTGRDLRAALPHLERNDTLRRSLPGGVNDAATCAAQFKKDGVAGRRGTTFALTLGWDGRLLAAGRTADFAIGQCFVSAQSAGATGASKRDHRRCLLVERGWVGLTVVASSRRSEIGFQTLPIL